MGKNYYTSKIVDEIIRFGAMGAVITAVAVAPNTAQILAKPLIKLGRKLDKSEAERESKRESQRVIRYMKQQGLLAGDYEHGLKLTKKARKRLKKIELESIIVQPQSIWDKKWRIIIYDIPETHRSSRDAFWSRLQHIGCFQLQKSTWITPFSCQKEISALAVHHGVEAFVTYFEALNLANDKVIIKRFKQKYPSTHF